MIQDYKFQDLAKFIDDVKFLIARGGSQLGGIKGVGGPVTIIELIFRVIWLFILWVVLMVIVYTIYKIIFYGYPRFPLDLLKLKFSNKVSVKSVVGDVNGQLYKYVMELTNGRLNGALEYFNKQGFMLLNDDCTRKDCISVFHDLDRVITEEYDSEYNSEKVEAALDDYYKYYDSIISNLNIRGQEADMKINKLKDMYENVFKNYINYYQSEILTRENAINCKVIDGKTDEKRGQAREAKKSLENELKGIFKTMNIKKIDTTCLFARLFPDPSQNLECSVDINVLVNQKLVSLGYDGPKNRYRQLEREIRKDSQFIGLKLPKDKKRAKERIRKKKEEQRELKIQMIDMKNQALVLVKSEMKDTLPMLPIANPTSKDIILYTDNERIYPNTTRLEDLFEDNADTGNNKNKKKKNKKDIGQHTVYVPCYELYKHYYTLNFEKMFKGYSKTLSPDEIVAFIFLTDVEKLMGNKERKANNEAQPTIISKYINVFNAIENMSTKVKETLNSSKSPIEIAQYLIFPEDTILQSTITDVVKYQKNVSPLYSRFGLSIPQDKGSIPEFNSIYDKKSSEIKVSNDYTYYLMEMFAYMKELEGKTPGNDMNYIYQRYVSHIKLYEYNKSALIAFLNLPIEKQNNTEIRRKFGITERLFSFVKRHPIFSMVYLNNGENGDLYHRIMGMFVDLLQDNKQLLSKVYQINTLTREEVVGIIGVIEKKVFGIKEVIVCLHMINLYFSYYRDTVSERDPISRIKISRDGLVDIYNQQNISPEFGSFFARLFEPFKKDFVDGRIKASWRKAFYGPRFNPDLKKDKRNISYWRDFNVFWVDYMGKKMNGMMKSWWNNFKNFTKPRKF
jgi:hypothetical protein